MSELVEFIRGCLDADEQTARAAIVDNDGTWTAEGMDEDGIVRMGGGLSDCNDETIVYDEGRPSYEESAHMARHDPARVLAEVAAKRAIVEIHEGYEGYGGSWWCNQCADGAYGDRANWPCQTLRALASVYEGAPGWREEWR